MKLLPLAGLLAAISFAPAVLASSANINTATPLQAEDIFRLAGANDVQISPDGKRVVYGKRPF